MSQEEIPAVPVALQGVRRRGEWQGPRGRFWKSLDELSGTPAFLDYLHREFPEQASVFEDPKGRREFLTLMGASLALAGLTACTKQPEEKILPYVRQPEGLVPGRPLFFATAYGPDGYARGILVESHEGRPTKIEGNPDHPTSLGATDVFGQAHVLGLYDPDRSKAVLYVGAERTWPDFRAALGEILTQQKRRRGAGLRFLTGRTTSPTLVAQMSAIQAALPEARFVSYEPVSRDNARAGAVLAFGEPVEAQYRFDQADVVLSLEADFLMSHPAGLRLQREFAARRKVKVDEPRSMNRLYVVEGSPTPTGAAADHCLPLRSSAIEGFARSVAAGLGVAVEGGVPHAWVAPLVSDLRRSGARALVIAGESQPPAVHAIAHAINEALGAVGTTVVYTQPAERTPEGGETADLRALVAEMRKGRVEVLVIVGANPVYVAPADLDFAQALEKVPLRIHHGLSLDETAERCHWHLPASHPLESWGDLRAVDGTVSLVQPLIAPLYDTLSESELLAVFAASPEQKGHDVLRAHWQDRAGRGRFREALEPRAARRRRGGHGVPAEGGEGDGRRRVDARVEDRRRGWVRARLPQRPFRLRRTLRQPRLASGAAEAAQQDHLGQRGVPEPEDGREARRDPHRPDGPRPRHRRRRAAPRRPLRAGAGLDPARPCRRHRHRAPGLRPAACGADRDGRRLRRVRAPHERRAVDGRRPRDPQDRRDRAHRLHAGPLDDREPGRRAGARAPRRARRDPRRAGQEPAGRAGAGPRAGPRPVALPRAQVRRARLGHVDRHERLRRLQRLRRSPASPRTTSRWWGRSRSAAAARCTGSASTATTRARPRRPRPSTSRCPCMHCEKAPCEVVCPVAATVHSEEGLNDMVYNRCVGTRYCSNNCPYKVRRFNFLLYQDWETPSYKMMRNPEVTVRSRGVMEKCTYCVQRIVRTRIDAKNEDRAIQDGEITPACAQACPSQAIVFGDLNDAKSRVAALQKSERRYALLDELQTQPRTTYLAAVRNPNPEIPSPQPKIPAGESHG